MNSNVSGWGDVKKSIDIFNYKQRLLSIDMKTKVVQCVPMMQVIADMQVYYFYLVYFSRSLDIGDSVTLLLLQTLQVFSN